MRRVAFICAITILMIGARAQEGVKHEVVIWYQFSEKVKMSDKLDLSFHIQYRDFIEREQFYHLYLSAGINYKLANGFGLGAGLIDLNIHRFVGTDYVLMPELRPYQQLTYGAKFENLQFNWRFMLEERYFSKAANGELVSGHDFNFRLRNLAKVTIPVSKSFDLAVGTEVLINAGGRANLNVFDQHRTTVLGSFKTGKLKLSTGYMHWAALTGGDVLENRHTWLITAAHSL